MPCRHRGTKYFARSHPAVSLVCPVTGAPGRAFPPAGSGTVASGLAFKSACSQRRSLSAKAVPGVSLHRVCMVSPFAGIVKAGFVRRVAPAPWRRCTDRGRMRASGPTRRARSPDRAVFPAGRRGRRKHYSLFCYLLSILTLRVSSASPELLTGTHSTPCNANFHGFPTFHANLYFSIIIFTI